MECGNPLQRVPPPSNRALLPAVHHTVSISGRYRSGQAFGGLLPSPFFPPPMQTSARVAVKSCPLRTGGRDTLLVVRTRVLWPQPRAAFANRRPVIYGSEYKGFFINSVRPNRPSAIPFWKHSPPISHCRDPDHDPDPDRDRDPDPDPDHDRDTDRSCPIRLIHWFILFHLQQQSSDSLGHINNRPTS